MLCFPDGCLVLELHECNLCSEQDVQDRKVFTVCKPLPLRKKKNKPKVKKREGIMTEEKRDWDECDVWWVRSFLHLPSQESIAELCDGGGRQNILPHLVQ